MNDSKSIILNHYDNNKNMTVSEHIIEAGHIVPIHWHDFYELEFLISGEALHNVNNISYKLLPGCSYIMTYHCFHSIKALTELRILNISFNGFTIDKSLIDSLTIKSLKLHCHFEGGEFNYIYSLMKSALEESKKNKLFSEKLIANITEQVSVYILRKSTVATDPQIPYIIQQVTALINSSFQENITLKKAAHALFYSPNYLGVIFHSYTGQSFHDYLNAVRLRYSCELLNISDISIKEIAFASGFNSAEHFSYTFKKHIGMTPGKYRLCH